MKKCIIYKTQTEYIIVTYSESNIGLYIIDDPIFIIPLNDDLSLQNAIFASLKSSKKGIPIPTPLRDEWTKWQKEQLAKMKQKTFLSLYKKSSSCEVILEENVIKVYPEKYSIAGKPNQGLVNVKEDMVEIRDAANNQEKVTLTIIEILNRKYR